MTDSELQSDANKRRRVEGHIDSFISSSPIHDEDEPRRKAIAPTIHHPNHQDPKLVHYLDGHHIIRHSHNPLISGGFCDIFTGDHPVHGKVAMKRPRMTEKGYTSNEMTNFLISSTIWKKLRHPNILQFIGLIQSDGHIWAVSSFAENGSLPRYLKQNPLTDRRALVLQLADAIGYLHGQGVVHGDIKGSGILISAAHTVLLCDFGLSKLSGTSTSSSLSGAASMRWCAPEILFEEAPKTYASDVYSFGMTVYEILSDNVPLYDIANEILAIKAINDGVRPAREPAQSEFGYPYEQLWDIASECWDGNPSNRPSMDAICGRLCVTVTSSSSTTVKETSGMMPVPPISTSALVASNAEHTFGAQRDCVPALSEEPSVPINPSETASFVTPTIELPAPWNSLKEGLDLCTTTINVMNAVGDPSRPEIDVSRFVQLTSSQTIGTDTRVELLETIHRWIDGTGPNKEPIFWLSGEAGTGKSTIAHTIAEDRDRVHQLGACLFFSRNEEARRDANLFISTLACQLSGFDEEFKRHLAAALERDPAIPEKTIKIQLKEMVMEPLKKSRTVANGPVVVVVVDALDECSPESGAEEILEAWAYFIQNFPLQFRLLITSRPSWHIQAKLSSTVYPSSVFHLRDISKIIVRSDIEHYLLVSLADVLGNGLLPADLELLSHRIGRLFILASTYVKYIKDPFRGDPQAQLRALLSRKATLGLSPVAELDTLYLDIVRGIPQGYDTQSVIEAFREVVGAMVVVGLPMTPIQLSSFLKMEKGDVLFILRRLSSVVFLPNENAPASFFHQSFSEFLTDSKRCIDPLYAIDKSGMHRRMAIPCLDIFDTHLQDNVPAFDLPHPTYADSDIEPDNEAGDESGDGDDTQAVEVVESEIPEAVSLTTSKPYPDELCYASVYFAYHLNGVGRDAQEASGDLLKRFERFYEEKLRRWLEVIYSLNDTPGIDDLPLRLHNGFIKYYQTMPSSRMAKAMLSMQRSLKRAHTAPAGTATIPVAVLPSPLPTPAETAQITAVINSAANRVTAEARTQAEHVLGPVQARAAEFLAKQRQVLAVAAKVISDEAHDALVRRTLGEQPKAASMLFQATQSVVYQAARQVQVDKTAVATLQSKQPGGPAPPAALAPVSLTDVSIAIQSAVAHAVAITGSQSSEIEVMLTASSLIQQRSRGDSYRNRGPDV